MHKYTTPEQGSDAFNCPFCHAYSRQHWPDLYWGGGGGALNSFEELSMSYCERCGRQAIWISGKLLYPADLVVPPASEDMPSEIAQDYEEARKVFAASPRSSAALLRLVVQKLCIHMGLPGKNLNDDIGQLVKAGLPDRAQKALDIVRVVGNNQVHPGNLDIRDSPETAITLFNLVNLIVESLITMPKRVNAVFDTLPNTAKEQIVRRDAKSAGPNDPAP